MQTVITKHRGTISVFNRTVAFVRRAEDFWTAPTHPVAGRWVTYNYCEDNTTFCDVIETESLRDAMTFARSLARCQKSEVRR